MKEGKVGEKTERERPKVIQMKEGGCLGAERQGRGESKGSKYGGGRTTENAEMETKRQK